MDRTGRNMKEDIQKKTDRIKNYLEEHNCQDVTGVHMTQSSWTDAFVIGTVNSVGHLKGVVHQLWDEINDLELKVNNRHKTQGNDGWALIDCGEIVIHLMSQDVREGTNLEKLWKVTEEYR